MQYSTNKARALNLACLLGGCGLHGLLAHFAEGLAAEPRQEEVWSVWRWVANPVAARTVGWASSRDSL